MSSILTSIHGRRVGLSAEGGIVLNKSRSGRKSLVGQSIVTRVTSAQVLALNATPIAVVPAQGAGIAILVNRVAIYKPAGTAYGGIGSTEELVLKYTNASGTQLVCAIETTGFLDQTTAQTRVANPPATTGSTVGDFTPVANAAVVLHLLVGEITTGNSDLYVQTWYDLMETAFTA